MKARAGRKVTPTTPRVSEKTISERREQEKLLLATIFQILTRIDLSEESVERRSIEWLAIEVADRLDEVDRSKLSTTPPAPPSGAEPYYEAHSAWWHSLGELEVAIRSPKARRAFNKYWDDVHRLERAVERLFAVIGFAIGLKAGAIELRRISVTLSQAVSAEYTVATPEPTEKQLQLLDDLALGVEWKPGEYQKLEQAGRGRHWQNRERYVAYVAHLIRMRAKGVLP